ncbi:tRNA delta(2)-isopentenylpyrophosphate transferase [Ammonifex degensii KC4]|uniref:tRNA dimethylallyltransferase n=1 Tax=Ammonifex degensii (strain DSM 10501 / KC4) TaxID=429009 RepID=C9R9M3_AMMDK|nr:tRNA (adenosine(37)-N6)-dimethylallyltransferase MiaA [Ammonifex degensii]ACX53002.1 tRNA delta(2)-isopentenylpyrophosphate transferase [Ammonifex degensii KC4]
MKKLWPLVVITGPTATGKTAVGIEVALRLGGEIISADSMMVYKGMDIGTAKPSLEERKGVPHHLIDVVEPHEHFSVGAFQALARKLIEEIHSRGKLPLLVGGTALYIRAVIDGYIFTVKADKELRQRLLEEAQEKGTTHLHAQLQAIDPQAAAKIHPRDRKRLVRALEIYYQTGKPPSEVMKKEPPPYDVLMFGLNLAREELYRRIEQRVDAMLAAGLVEEVRRLLEQGVPPQATSMQGLGYKEIAAYLRGEISLERAVYLIKRNTRRFAKRQLTWFRHDPRIRWLDVAQYKGIEDLAEEIVRQVQDYFGFERKS